MERRLICGLVNLSWRLLPVTRFRSWLLDTHLDACPACQQKIASREEARTILTPGAEEVFPEHLMLGAIEKASRSPEALGIEGSQALRGQTGWLTRIYIGLTALIIVILMAGFAWYFSQLGREKSGLAIDETNRTNFVSDVSLRYVRTRGRPADSIIYKTSDPEMIIIWVETRN